MKRALLPFFLVCMLAGQVSAELSMYTLDADSAWQFWSFSVEGSDMGDVPLVTDSSAEYGADTMMGQVGYVGWLWDDFGDEDTTATISIYTEGNAGLEGEYAGFRAFVANDDDDPWSVRLFVTTEVDGVVSTSYSGDGDFTAIAPNGTSTWLATDTAFDFANVTSFGFEVLGIFGQGSPSNPDFFHISAVPTPAAVLIGMLGLGVAGLKLRKFV